MAKGKRLKQAYSLVNRDAFYPIDKAVDLIKSGAKAKFDETIEIAMNLGIDPRHSDQNVRGVVLLPHGTGKSLRVAVFAKGPKAEAAKAAGADIVGAEDLAEKVQAGQIEFDRCIATPDMMGVVGKLGKVLGPRGLMPNPKTGTVTFEVGKAVAEIRKGRVEYKTEKAGIVQVPVGKVSFEANKLHDNANAILESVMKARPASVKGRYLRSATLSSTMGPGIKLDPMAIAKQWDA